MNIRSKDSIGLSGVPVQVVRYNYPYIGLKRPGQALRLPKVQVPRISIQSAHENGKVGSPKHQPSLTPRRHP
jgi:hypothetical protein